MKSAGSKLIGGTVNGSGGLVMRAEKVGRDTALARMVDIVAEAQRSRAPAQRLADRVSGWFVPLVGAVAVVAFLAWLTFGPEPRLAFALVAAVSVLIIACPCALGLATPMAIMVGVGAGARAGVLIRDAEALERFETVDTLVVDKTGTLTEGKPRLTAIEAAPGFPADDALRLAASLERSSEHPIAARPRRGGAAEAPEARRAERLSSLPRRRRRGSRRGTRGRGRHGHVRRRARRGRLAVRRQGRGAAARRSDGRVCRAGRRGGGADRRLRSDQAGRGRGARAN